MSQARGGLSQSPSHETLSGLMQMAKEHESFIKAGEKDWPKIDWRALQAKEKKQELAQNQAARLSHLTIEVGETQAVISGKGDEDGAPTTLHVLLLHPERIHVTERLRDHLKQAIPDVMDKCFRLEPGYQDFSAKEIGDPIVWVIHVMGLTGDPMARQRLMRAGAMVNGTVEAEGFMMKA